MGKLGEVVKEHDVEWEPAYPIPVAVPEAPSTPAHPGVEPELEPGPELVPAGVPEEEDR